jgi:lipopolysaccharide assembly protein A
MLSLVVLSVVLLFVVTFALQNPPAVTVRFLMWQLDSSLAIVILAATAAGVLVAELFHVTKRLLRWKRDSP